MHIDLYTKTILTLIALLLAVIVLKPIIQPPPALAQAQTTLNGIQLMGIPGNLIAVDNRTGDIWAYRDGSEDYSLTKMYHWGRFTGLGKPLAK